MKTAGSGAKVTSSSSAGAGTMQLQKRKRRKAEVQVASCQQQQQQQHQVLNNLSLQVKAPGHGPQPFQPRGGLPACAVRLIRNDLARTAAAPPQAACSAQGYQLYQLPSQIHFASGAPVLLRASVSGTPVLSRPRLQQYERHHEQSASNAVQLDLTAVAGSVRAEIAFTGALEPETSATGPGGRQQMQVCQQQQQQQPPPPQQGSDFVQVRNPLCVPRRSDFLSSWRTCMVPIADLEMFASLKPPCRRWRHLANRSPSCIGGAGGSSQLLLFTLMCYNILSDQYASAKSYWYCPDWALSWAFRRQGILENICALMPSVVCLQEVETEQFYSFFLPHMNRRGYDGIFSPKSRARTMEDRLRKRVDGCAIFWKRCEFRLVEEHVIEFSQQYLEHCWSAGHSNDVKLVGQENLPQHHLHHQPAQPPADAGQKSSPRGQASSEIFNRVTIRDNIALAVILAPVARPPGSASPGTVMICTSHIHWDPQFSDVKLIQTVVLTSALAAKIKQFRASHRDAQLPLVLCGDFNSLPNSGVIEFLHRGSVARDHPEFQRLGADPSLDGLRVVGDSPQSFSHSLDLASCYGSSVDIACTNYTHEFKGIIDYIFASRGHFRVLNSLEGLSHWFQSESIIGCPHPYVPSDHIPLAVQLEMKL